MIRCAIVDRTYRGKIDARRWMACGVEYVQLREKMVDAGDLSKLARWVLQDLGEVGPGMKLLVNGRADVAAAVGAVGVHLTAHPEELTPQQVREVFAKAGRGEPSVSVSCHTLAEVQRACRAGASFAFFGPVFEKRVGGQAVARGVGLDVLRKACQAAGAMPVLAIGGVSEENAGLCEEAGAAGIAAIRMFGAQ